MKRTNALKRMNELIAMPTPNHRTKPYMTQLARELREDSTIPERQLWRILLGRQLAGLKFRRQRPIGKFIADFICLDAKLIVELDGYSHLGTGDADDARTRFLEAEGFRVIRVTNREVTESPELVAEYVARQAGVNW